MSNGHLLCADRNGMERKMGIFTSWTKKDEKEFWKSEVKKAKKLGFEEGQKEGYEQALKEEYERELKKGYEEGQMLLATTIQRLKNGESPESIRKSGVDERTINRALTCR